MILEAESFENGGVLHADVCIVGGGAAGLTLACELDGTELNVVVLEGGGLTFASAAQDSLRGNVAPGSTHSPLHMYRRLVLGGATSIWGGRCVPLDPIDLEARVYVRHSGWPVCWEELSVFYPRAHEYCEVGTFAYDVANVLGDIAPQSIDGFADPDVLASLLERFSPPTNFGKVSGARLSPSANVRILVNAVALRLRTHDGLVASVDIAVARRRRLSVRARRYVIACGGLETTRLLLASDDTRRGGLGNESGALGCFYMCHLEKTFGRLQLTPPTRAATVRFERAPDGTYVRRKFVLAAAAQRREALLNSVFRLHHPLSMDPTHGSGVLSAMYLVKDFILPEYTSKLTTSEIASRHRAVRNCRFWLTHIANIARDFPTVARFGAIWLRRRTFAARKLPFVVLHSEEGGYPLEIYAEQIPNPNSRVSLSRDLDAHGVPRLDVDWRSSLQDVDSLCRSAYLWRSAFARQGCGNLEFDETTLKEEFCTATPVGGHHLGTTRMSNSRHDGVVDANCRVYGLANLYLASGSVFPTCGHANPTLTIVALTIRLADHLKHEASRAKIPLI